MVRFDLGPIVLLDITIFQIPLYGDDEVADASGYDKWIKQKRSSDDERFCFIMD